MAPKASKDVLDLPQKGTWQCYVHKLRAWVQGDDGVPVRPYLMLVISTEVGETAPLLEPPFLYVSGRDGPT